MPDLNLTGSCLCGAIRYEISGELKRFYHCHCQRCRKATGTGHATNILLKPDSVHWSSGEDLLKSFRPPDAGLTWSSHARPVRQLPAAAAWIDVIDGHDPRNRS